MLVNQLAVFLENRKGRLKELAGVLAKEKIDILTLSIADTEDFGIVRFITTDNARARSILRDEGFTVTETELIGVEIGDVPGALAKVLKALADGDISIEYLYSYSRTGGNAIILFKVKEVGRALDVLSRADVRFSIRHCSMNKRSARALAKARVKTLSDAEKLIKSGVIVNDVLSFVDENGIKSVFVYKSSDDEVQTNAIIDGLFERGVKVYIPKISGDLMRLSVISKKSKFVRNIFGIFETTDDGEDFFDAELNIVPLVAFDKTLTRLGHGKGYYDRYLEKATGRILALAYDCQEIDEIDSETHDVKMQLVITESGRKGG